MPGETIVPFNKEQIAVMLQEMAVKIKTEEDILELKEIGRVFRKNVPITMRTYMAAYILKQFSRDGRRMDSGESGRSKREREHGGEKLREKRPRNRVPLDEALATTLFFSIGRNRRVFPRDIVALISHAANIDRERIGDIRVLDNYSFVQLLSEDTDAIISALDGYEYRGRKLSVSYSRKKDDDDGDISDETAESHIRESEQDDQETTNF